MHNLKARVGQLPQSYGVYYKNTLVALCHAMEDHILETQNQPLVLASFQKGKWYLQEAKRYRDIAHSAREVVILFAEESGFPQEQATNVHLVPLASDDPVTQEWNLVIYARDYQAMVLCQELSESDYGVGGLPREDSERKFYGLWTFDRHLVAEALAVHLERIARYNTPLAEQLGQTLADIIQSPAGPHTDMNVVVSRIVNYLQTSQLELVTLNRQRQAYEQLESQENKLHKNLTANKLQAFLRMAQRVDDQDPYNPSASWQVAALAETLGQLLDLASLSLRRLRLAGVLFRLGLAQVPPEVFLKAERERNDSESALWNNHPQIAAKLLQTMPELGAVTHIIAHQKEWWDGTGRPDGLQGEDIPLEARVLGLVATFQRLLQPRGTRPGYDLAEALSYCQKSSGTRWDPHLVEVLTHVVKLSQMGLLQLPTRPQGVPSAWVGEGLSG
ncbi:HD domain-containing phosphohydrolase [Candidatus Cyanaurora vandensis]|uniref:HD domain-containing phosphohydrolase n=1 Tax=Candidatus Cyanaurora vandensis TaxID=2714958 RepID=UPI00257B0DAB|nr:HD domain-containing phosphohydrolase [Candidatus Cyanaurora vandensis]